MEALAAAALVAVAALAAVLVVMTRRPAAPSDLSTPLQNLAAAVQSTNTQVAVVAERMGAVAQRVAVVEQQQLAAQAGLNQAATAIRAEVTRTQQQLGELKSAAEARREMEQRTAESIRRLETVIAGTATKGAAGESVIEFVFAQLPAAWQVRDFEVGNRRVEFGLRLPNALVLPIDSKWPATNLLEQFLAAEAPDEQKRLKQQLEQAVVAKASEVRKYLDPNLTVNFGVAVLPDAVYELCGDARVKAMEMHVVLVSASLFVPYLLLVFETVLGASRDIDLDRLLAALGTVEESLKAMQDEVEGRLSKAVTMAGNSRDELRNVVARAGASLSMVRLPAAGNAAPALPAAAGDPQDS